MGWRERDWARFNRAERRIFYGGGPSDSVIGGSVLPPTRSRRRGFHLGSAAIGACGVAVAALLLGQFPRSHPLVPEFGFDIRGALAAVRGGDSDPQRHPLRLPARVTAPSRLQIAGRLPDSGGRIVIYGHWNAERWHRISTAPVAASGDYSATIRIRRAGMLNLRVRTPSGDLLVGSTRVRE